MPLLNPGIVAHSPFLADNFTVTRMKQTISPLGRVSTTPSHICAHGIVTNAKRGDLQNLPEASLAENVISVISETPLLGLQPGSQPDVITWRGTSYKVIHCAPYPQFGRGWYKVLAASQNAIDLPPEPDDGQ